MAARTADLLAPQLPALLLPAGVEGGLAGACLHQLFEGRVEAEPAATALVVGESRICYRELERRANRLARRLRELDAGPEVRVAVCLERTPELVVALLAVLKAGAAYVPIDPAYPRERQAILLADSRPSILVTQEHLLQRLPAFPAGLVCVDRDRAEIELRSDAPFAARAVPANLAYLIYTSGSTGRPKAVALAHRSAVARMRCFARMFPRCEMAGVLGSTSICFDLSVFEIFATLAAGGTLILAENALALPSLPAAAEVTLLNTVPSAAAELVRSGGLPSSVRVVNLAGEALRRVLVERLYALGHVEKVYNLYGPSEDTTYSTWALMRRGDPLPPAIGVTLDGTRGHLLDREGRQVGAADEGELYLGGVGLARGYLDRPDVTAERFVPDPFSPAPGERLYATGDLVRRRPSGELDYLGRLDFQVKIRGFRVELGEIEAALDRIPGVADAVVVARDVEGRGDVAEKVLVAYVVPDPGTTLDVTALRKRLQASLTDAMVPACFVELPQLPLSPNGKVDRKALPAPDFTAVARDWLAPRTPTEEVLAGIWADALDLPRVGVEDDFFALGGHSLSATRAAARARELLGVELGLRDLFAAPTVAKLAARLGGSPPPAAGALSPSRAGPVPSAQQEALWFAERLHAGLPLFTMPIVLDLLGEVDPAVLRRALTEIARRHEALRTVLAEAAGRLTAVLLPAAALPLPVIDLRALPPEAARAEGAFLGRQESRRFLDLGRGPLLHAALVRLAGGEHQLWLTLHHAAGDDWSTEVLVRELAALYPAFAAGRPSPLPELTFRYADYAAWQREWLEGPQAAAQLAAWRRHLEGGPEILNLPFDRPRPPAQGMLGDRWLAGLPAAEARQLSALARRSGGTLFMALLAGLTALVHRYTGGEDLVISSAIANRVRAGTEDLIGLLTNNLPLRFDLSGSPAFAELLTRVREVLLAAIERQEIPFDRLLRELLSSRLLSHAPLAQVGIVFQSVRGLPAELAPGIRMALREEGNGTAKVDLLAYFREERDGSVTGAWEYASCLFDPATAARMAGHFRVLLRAAAEQPDRPLAEQPLLTAGERQQSLAEWNDVRSAYPREACVHDLVAGWVAQTPDAVALVWGDRRLTYGELDRRAERLARRLRALGVGPDVLVTLLMERSADLVIAQLAVLKAGGAYVPLDPAYPRELLAGLLAESRTPVVIADPHWQDRLPRTAARVVSAGLGWEEAAGGAPPCGPPCAQPHNLAYVMFTSGTTGRAKGVAVPHRAVVRLVRNGRWGRLDADETLLLLAAVSFDASTLEIWGALANGGRLVIYPGQKPTLEELGETLVRHGVTTLWLTAGLFHQMVERHLQGLRAVRRLMTGGDVVSAAHVAAVLAALPACTVVDGYGPTENTTFTSCEPITAGSRLDDSVPIGRPVTDTSALIVDRWLQPLPAGVPGELVTGGDGLARGYLGRPDLTAERFVPAPAGLRGEPGGRVYRTGDLARWLPDGRLDFLGRIDQQVKIRGFRIEPSEIEAALILHPEVASAVVVARQGRSGLRSDRELAAYVLAHRGGEAPAVSALRAWLRDRLPEPMIPTAWVFLDELPLDPNGKVDRRALPAPERPAAVTGARTAPRTPTEEAVAAIWVEVLGVPAVGVDDDFFDLGGHSLLATRVISRLRDTFGVELPLRQVFENPSVAGLSSAVDVALGLGGGLDAAPIPPAPRDGELPLSFGQQRLWFLDRLEPGTPAFNLPAPLRLDGSLNVAALAAALRAIVARHESLRTRFDERDGRAHQIVVPRLAVDLPRVDLDGLEPAAREAEALRLADEEALLPFDLRRGPLLRTVLLRLAAERHVLLATLHHIVSDGWSTAVFRRELGDLYAAAVAGRPSPLSALPLQVPDWAAWQRRTLGAEAVAALLDRWKARFGAELPDLRLPTDRPRPAVRAVAGDNRSALVPPDLLGGVRELSRASGTTLFMTLLAAFQALLARYTGQERIVVGSPAAGRGRAELQGLIGFFVNNLVLPVDLAGDPTFAEILARVRETALSAYACQDLPFERLVQELQPVRDRGRTPLFQVMFALQNALETGARTAAGLTLSPFPVTLRAAQFDLTLATVETAEGLLCVAEYSTGLFDGATIERLLEHYRSLLAAAVAAPGARLSALPPAAAELPRPAAETVAAPVAGTAADARRARLLARRDRLPEAQRRLLEERLRGVAPAPAAAPAAAGCLVEITPARGDSRPPFFCVHPAGGDVLCFFPLARHLGADQPFYGFQARGLEDEAEPFATLEEMAAHYVAEIRRLQPRGPYRLGGWSFGGLAAFEMACQLTARGEEVALLSVIDTAPGVSPEEADGGSPYAAADGDDTPWLVAIAEYVRGLRGVDLGLEAARLAPLAPEERLRACLAGLRAAGLVHASDDGMAQLRRLLRVFKTDVRAYRRYRPHPYPGPVTLFRAADAPLDPDLGRDLGWGRLTPHPVAVHEVAGGHVTLLAEPHVAVLAGRLRACLTAESPTGGSP